LSRLSPEVPPTNLLRFLRRHVSISTLRSVHASKRYVVPKVIGLSLLRLLRPLAAEHHELVRHDLRGVAIIAVAVLPFPRPQLPLDVALRSLPQILRRDLGEPTEERHAVPLRPLLLVACLLVLPCLARRDTKIRHRAAARHVAGFWVRTQAPDELHLVQTAHAAPTFRSSSSTCTASA